MIDKSAFIHPTAIVEEGASIGANAHIGPFCIVGPHVEIGEGTVLKSHVVVNGHTKIGRDNEIYQFASIGEVNQDLKYAGEPTRVEIGDRNRIRESVTIHRGTVQGGGVTKVGSDNLLMINAHVAHDCTVGNRCILANNATLAGHVSLDDFVIIGGMTAVHQFCIIGAHVMVGGCSGVQLQCLRHIFPKPHEGPEYSRFFPPSQEQAESNCEGLILPDPAIPEADPRFGSEHP